MAQNILNHSSGVELQQPDEGSPASGQTDQSQVQNSPPTGQEPNLPVWPPKTQTENKVSSKQLEAPAAKPSEGISLGWIVLAIFIICAIIAFIIYNKNKKAKESRTGITKHGFSSNDKKLLDLAKLINTVYKKT